VLTVVVVEHIEKLSSSASLSAAALAMFELEEGGSSFTGELAKNSSK
jgi:hypothetical protein